jgi:cardiolipin synthase
MRWRRAPHPARRWTSLRSSRLRAALAALALAALAGCSHPPRYIAPDVSVGDYRAFARAVEAHTLSGIVAGNRVELLLNGEQIFPAMLAAIREARASVTLANYIWETGAIADEFAAALAERCRAGVGVNVLVDAVGSHAMTKENQDTLTRAGCHFVRFHPLNPLNPQRFNRRNHRRVLVVDGHLGFTGGTGIGTKWTGDGRRPGHWRQTDVKVEGPIVKFLQAAFAENWRDETGILLGGDAYFPEIAPRGDLRAQSVKSSPGAGTAEAYALLLLAIEGARTSIDISSPYFVPDAGMKEALARAVRRGVRVSVLVAGEADNVVDRVVRLASRAEFGAALESGVKIYEYAGAMLHAKTVTVDGAWACIGSINVDNRSFGLNHEASLVVYDAGIARRLEAIYRDDLTRAREVTLEDWKRRGIGHFLELFVLPLHNAL